MDTFEADSIPDIRQHPVVGVDVGIKHLAVTSEGVYYENLKALKRYERKLKRLQRQLSRRQKRGRNWHKTQVKLAKLHYRITCIRQDAQHKVTTAIVNGASRIGIESLNVAGMLKNHRLAKALSDASLSSFLAMLKYTVVWTICFGFMRLCQRFVEYWAIYFFEKLSQKIVV